jgi:DNA-binding NarL/FixJ family response regulator
MKNTIFLVDDHGLMREGLRAILQGEAGFQIIGEAADGLEALQQIESRKPDLVLLDISLPSMSGIDITRRIKKNYPQIKIIALSRHDNMEYVDPILQAGAEGYVLKDEVSADLKQAMTIVLRGESYLSPRITKEYLSSLQTKQKNAQAPSPFPELSVRETEILRLLAEGQGLKDIASKLWISEATAKTHKNNIMRKLDVHTSVDLVRLAWQRGLLPPGDIE